VFAVGSGCRYDGDLEAFAGVRTFLRVGGAPFAHALPVSLSFAGCGCAPCEWVVAAPAPPVEAFPGLLAGGVRAAVLVVGVPGVRHEPVLTDRAFAFAVVSLLRGFRAHLRPSSRRGSVVVNSRRVERAGCARLSCTVHPEFGDRPNALLASPKLRQYEVGSPTAVQPAQIRSTAPRKTVGEAKSLCRFTGAVKGVPGRTHTIERGPLCSGASCRTGRLHRHENRKAVYQILGRSTGGGNKLRRPRACMNASPLCPTTTFV